MNTSSISRRVWRDQVQAADRRQRIGRQRDVDAVLLERALELARRRARRARRSIALLERLARLVGGLADRAALLRRQLGDAAQQVRQLGLAPEVADRTSSSALVSAAAAIAASPRSELVDPLGDALMRAAILVTSYSATVAAIAALSESLAIGM